MSWRARALVGAVVVAGLAGCSRQADSPASVTSVSVDASPAGDEPEVRASHGLEAYDEIVKRDVFRPLVKAKRVEGSDGPGAGSTSGPAVAKPATTPTPSVEPPDPVGDLALTGVVEVDRKLQALIEKVSTRVGEFVAVGEEFDGFRVASISIDAVALERDGRSYTLRMGEKELDETPSGSTATSEKPEEAAPRPTPGSGGPMGSMQISGEFGGDMLAWAERQSVSTLERMHRQYSSYMSPEQRRQSEEYIESRRRRGR